MTNIVKAADSVIFALFITIGLVFSMATAHAQEKIKQPASELPKVRFVTSEGAFEVQLRPDVAPKTVENFLEYVRNDFYSGTIFHRVIPGFMVQGGGFESGLTRKQTLAPVVNEATATLPNLRGTIAMARTSAPHSATSQFFINLVDNSFLNASSRDAGYAVFGKVTEGIGVVDSIAKIPTGNSRGMADVPLKDVVIKSISVLEPVSAK